MVQVTTIIKGLALKGFLPALEFPLTPLMANLASMVERLEVAVRHNDICFILNFKFTIQLILYLYHFYCKAPLDL